MKIKMKQEIKNPEVESLTIEFHKRLQGFDLVNNKWKKTKHHLFTTKHINLLVVEYSNLYYSSMYTSKDINSNISEFLHNIINYHTKYPDHIAGDVDDMKYALEIGEHYALLIKRIVKKEKSITYKVNFFIQNVNIKNINFFNFFSRGKD